MKRSVLLNTVKDYAFSLKKNEKVDFVIFPEKSGEMKLSVKLLGKNSRARIMGIFLGRGNEKFNLITEQDHQKNLTFSKLLVRTVLFGRARFNFQGLIKIAKNSPRSSAFQQNDNLLLNSAVRVKTSPALEIENNEVRCAHQVTAGKINETELFYLLNRGLNHKEAKKIIIEGFLDEVVKEIENAGIRHKISAGIQLKMLH